jgi:gliding motility-associatede transport system auxiliary component
MAEEKEKSTERRVSRKILEGTNFAVFTVVVIAIIALANWFVERNDKTWDLTPNKSYSLSPETVKILKGLDRDVTIYVFDRKEALGKNRDLLSNYGTASNRVTVKYVDADREPGLARQFAVRTYGTIVVAAGDRHSEAQSAGEEDVSNALIHVLKGQKTVYFVQGHTERDLDNTDRAGYDRIKKQLENENYQIKPLMLLQKMEIPADCSLLVVAGPQHDYLPPEVDAIRKYVTNGGRALLMLDPGVELPNLAKLLEDWNVTVQNDLVVDQNPVAQLFGTSPAMPLIVKYGSSPIVQPLERTATLFPFTRSFVIGKDYKAGVMDNSLCETSADSFGVADFNPKMESVSFRPGKDFKGPLTVAVSGDLTGGGSADKKAEGRFVALGTSAIASNVYLGFQGNRDLLMNMVNWLSAEEDLISIRPKPPESQHLDITAAQMARIKLLGLLGLPLLIVVAGISVWWRRR